MRREGVTLADLLCGLALAVAVFVFLAPVLWMVITAVKPPGEWLNTPPIFIPSELHWANFTDALFNWGGLKGLTDSLVVATLSTLLSLILGVPAAYAIGRYHTGGDNMSFTVLSILFMPPVAVAIPMYLFWSTLGLLDSYTALILQYTVFNIPFISWVLKSFFEDIPSDMEDSAMINGASRWRAFWEIAVPLARPAIFAVALLAFIFSWNEFFFAVILTRADVTTLPFILPVLMEGHDILWGDIAAIATLGALPVVILAFALQKYLVRGLSFGTVR